MSLAGTNIYLGKRWDRDPLQGARCCHRHLLQLPWWALPDLPTTSPGGPPSMSSSATVVVTIGSTGSTAQGAHHQCLLQQWWWPLLDSPAAPHRGPAIDVFYNFGGGRCRTRQQHPQGTTIDVFFNFGGGRRRTHRQRPPGGMPLTSSSTFMVATTAPASSTPQGARHRCLLQTTLVAAAGPTGSTPRGPAINVLQRVVAVASTFWQQLSGGHYGTHYCNGVLY
jgi:hypothetical protein